MKALLKTTFGFDDFRPGQEEAIGSLMAGEHTLVVMPTGAGKSLIYQFVAVSSPGVTLVISPLISLMQDQVDALARRRIPATYINSSISGPEQAERLEAMAAGAYRLVYVAPERLRSTAFQDALSKVQLALLAVDEAHCVSHWGHDFRPDYLHIASARSRWGNPLTAALTATATPQVRSEIAGLLGLGEVKHIVTGFNRPNLTFGVNYCKDSPGKLRSLLALLKSLDSGAAIVYAGTRRDAEEVADFITETAGIPARCYHAGLPTEAREKAQTEFMRGNTRVVVATNAFGMGIDRADVRLVAHYAIPGSLEAYYQEAGRAGRDGEPARATLLYCPDDRSLQEYFIDHSVLTRDDIHALHSALRAEAWLSSDDISIATGLHQVAVRVGLSVLESVGAVHVLETGGPRSLIRPGPLDETALESALAQAIVRADHRRAQLDRMVNYAESNSCRRRIILNHFGDPDQPSAPMCCDNCLEGATIARTGGAPSPPDSPTGSGRSPSRPEPEGGKLDDGPGHVVPDAVPRTCSPSDPLPANPLANEATPGLIAALGDSNGNVRRLAASALGKARHPSATQPLMALLGTERLPQVRQYAVKALGRIGDPQCLALLQRIASDECEMYYVRKAATGAARRVRPGHVVPDAVPRTCSPSDPVPAEPPADEAVPGLIAALGSQNAHVRQYAIKALGRIGDPRAAEPLRAIAADEKEGSHVRSMAEQSARQCEGLDNSAQRSDDQEIEPSTAPDPVDAYLSRSHPRPLAGPWRVGWALGFHSSFAGTEWRRSGVGEMTFRLKYRGDDSALAPLVDEALAVIREHPDLVEVDALVLVPPSTPRSTDPVRRFCEALAVRLKLPVLDVVTRTRQTMPQKEMHTLAQKRANVSGAFAVSENVRGRRLLVIDDLYDSGATLEEIVRTLTRSGAASATVLTLTRTIHSDA